jgi:hypothetical protein
VTRVLDGNDRIKELQGGKTDPETEIPVEELGEDEPMVPWE